MKWIKPTTRPHQTALAMIGAKPAQQVLLVGAGDGRLAAAVAAVTGLNGRTLVADPSADARTKVEAAAADEGVLIDFEQAGLEHLPPVEGGFDIVVILQRLSRPDTVPTAAIAAASRAVRESGRIVVIEGGSTRGVFGMLRRSVPAMSSEAVRNLLASAGLRAARVLAETEGVSYVEASKPRQA